jgi:hypothetical protein
MSIERYKAWKQRQATPQAGARPTGMSEAEKRYRAWAEKNKRKLDQFNERIVREREASVEPPVSKPVDMIKEERKPSFAKSLFSTAGSTISSGIKSMGTAIESKGKVLKQSDEFKPLGGISETDPYTKSVRDTRKAVGKVFEPVGGFIEGIGEKGVDVFSGGIDQRYASYRDEDGKLDPKKLFNPKNWAHSATRGGGSMAVGAGGALATLLATKNPATAGTVFMTSMGIQEKGSAVENFTRELADKKGVSVEELSNEDLFDIDVKSDAYGIIASQLEKIVPGNILARRLKKGTTNKLMQKALVRIPTNMLVDGILEGGTEATQEFTQNLISSFSEYSEGKKLTDGLIDSFLDGFFTGGAISGVSDITTLNKTQQTQQPQGLDQGLDNNLDQKIDTIQKESFEGTRKQYEDAGVEMVKDGKLDPKLVEGRVQDVQLKLNEVLGEQKAEQYRAEMLKNEFDSFDNLETKSKEVINSLKETPKETPRTEINPNIVVKDEEEKNSISLINAIKSGDTEKASDIADNLTDDELGKTLKVIQKVEEKVPEDIKPQITQQREFVENIVNERTQNEGYYKTREVINDTKTELLEQKSQAKKPEEKKFVQEKIDKVDDQRIALKNLESREEIDKVVSKMSDDTLRKTLYRVDARLDELKGKQRDNEIKKSTALREELNKYRKKNKKTVVDKSGVKLEVVEYSDGNWQYSVSIDGQKASTGIPFTGEFPTRREAINSASKWIDNFIKENKDDKKVGDITKVYNQLRSNRISPVKSSGVVRGEDMVSRLKPLKNEIRDLSDYVIGEISKENYSLKKKSVKKILEDNPEIKEMAQEKPKEKSDEKIIEESKGKIDKERLYLLKQEAELYKDLDKFIESRVNSDLSDSQLTDIWNKAGDGSYFRPVISSSGEVLTGIDTITQSTGTIEVYQGQPKSQTTEQISVEKRSEEISNEAEEVDFDFDIFRKIYAGSGIFEEAETFDIADDIAKAKAEGKSFEEFFEGQEGIVYHGGKKVFESSDELDFERGFYSLRKTEKEIKKAISEIKYALKSDVATISQTLETLKGKDLEEFKFLDNLGENASDKQWDRYNELRNKAARVASGETESDAIKKFKTSPARAFGGHITEIKPNLKNPLVYDAKGAYWMDNNYKDFTAELVDKAKKQGRDGVIIKNINEGFSSLGELGAEAGLVDDYIFLNKDALKTKSQLKKLWDETSEFKKISSRKVFKPLKPFDGLELLSTKVVEELKGKTIISKQFIFDLAKRQEVKQKEREIIMDVLSEFDNKVDVNLFAEKVNSRLMPLTKIVSDTYANYGMDNVGLDYDSFKNPPVTHIYDSPFEHGQKGHFGKDFQENQFQRSEEVDTINNLYKKESGLFGHTRIWEEKKERYVAEIQSDVFQGDMNFSVSTLEKQLKEVKKNRDERQKIVDRLKGDEGNKSTIENYNENIISVNKEISKIEKEIQAKKKNQKLKSFESYKNTWHERLIREEIKNASDDGMRVLRFPTPYTISKIEGYIGDKAPYEMEGEPEFGKYFEYGGQEMVVLKVFEDGSFQATKASGVRELSVEDFFKEYKEYENTDIDIFKEAKKYKTADEFVKAQGEPLYHGTASKFDKFDISKAGTVKKSDWGTGIYLEPNKDFAQRYAENAAGKNIKNAKVMETYIDPSAKVYKYNYERSLRVDEGLADKLKTQGYDVLRIEYPSEKITSEVIVMNPDVIKTKSQLTDIWNKAQNTDIEKALMDVFGENSFFLDGDSIIVSDNDFQYEIFESPESYIRDDIDKDDFDYETELDGQEQKTVARFYDQQVIKYLKKLRKNNLKLVEDPNGNTWLETQITEADSSPVMAYDLAKNKIDRYLSSEDAQKYVKDIQNVVNPVIAKNMLFKIVKEIVDPRGNKYDSIGLFNPLTKLMTFSRKSERSEFVEAVAHEPGHLAWNYLTKQEKDKIKKYVDGKSLKEKRDLFGKDYQGKWIYDLYVEAYKGKEWSLVQEVAVTEAAKDFIEHRYSSKSVSKLRMLMEQFIELLNVVAYKIFGSRFYSAKEIMAQTYKNKSQFFDKRTYSFKAYNRFKASKYKIRSKSIDNKLESYKEILKNNKGTEDALSFMWYELEQSEAGERIFVEGDIGGDEKVIAKGSTFPKWIPEEARNRQAIDRILPLIRSIDGIEIPSNKPERVLMFSILEELDSRLELDTADLRQEMLNEAEDIYSRSRDAVVSESGNVKVATLYRQVYREVFGQDQALSGSVNEDLSKGLITKSFKEGKLTGIEREKAKNKVRIQKLKEEFKEKKVQIVDKFKKKELKREKLRNELRNLTADLPVESRRKILSQERVFNIRTDKQLERIIDSIELLRIKHIKELELRLKRQAIVALIKIKDLKKTEQLRKSMGFPRISKMNNDQLDQLNEILTETADKDTFLTQRQLETIRLTELKGVKTLSEVRKKLAEKTGKTLEEVSNVEVSAFDNFRYDTALAEKNPFYELMVKEVNKSVLLRETEYLNTEEIINGMINEARRSRKRSLLDKAIPTDKKIFEYLESENKEEVAGTMTREELEAAEYIKEQYAEMRDYLVENQVLDSTIENYMVHIRRGFLETWKDDGFVQAFKEVFRQQEQDQAVFNILSDTGEILPLEKFFKFSMKRTGVLKPTNNVALGFLAYKKAFETKVALDSVVPKLSVYVSALTPPETTPKGLVMDRSLDRFFKTWLNNKRGRKHDLGGWLPQGGKLDVLVWGVKGITTILDLGLNIPVGIASQMGEQVTNLTMLGSKKYIKGVARSTTAKGRRILEKNKNFIGRSPYSEFFDPNKNIWGKTTHAMFILFRDAQIRANKIFLLGQMTDQEFQNEEISDDRLAELNTEMGRYRVVSGAKSIAGSTSVGGVATQYKTWAVPIIRTTAKNLSRIHKDGLKSKGNMELLRISVVSAFFGIIALSLANDDDDSFIGKIQSKVIRESLTLIGALNPSVFIAEPRVMNFILDLRDSLTALATLERYKTTKKGKYKEGDLKGPKQLERTITPRFIKNITE